MGMMEKYTYNLEECIEERTQQLVEEKKKTDRLLYRMLPSYVAIFLACINQSINEYSFIKGMPERRPKQSTKNKNAI